MLRYWDFLSISQRVWSATDELELCVTGNVIIFDPNDCGHGVCGLYRVCHVFHIGRQNLCGRDSSHDVPSAMGDHNVVQHKCDRNKEALILIESEPRQD